MIRACVFDRDDVLTYFDYQAAAAFFTSLIPVPLAELAERWRAFGGTVTWIRSFDEETQILQRFWQQLGDRYALPAASREALRAWDYTSILRPYPEVVAALEALRRRELKIGVLSNFRLASIRKSLQAVHLDSFVDVACSATVIGARKPNASAYLTIIEALKVRPSECCFFDNRTENVAAARALGMRAYLVDRKRTTHDLERRILCDLSPIEDLLDVDSAR